GQKCFHFHLRKAAGAALRPPLRRSGSSLSRHTFVLLNGFHAWQEVLEEGIDLASAQLQHHSTDPTRSPPSHGGAKAVPCPSGDGTLEEGRGRQNWLRVLSIAPTS